MPSLRHSDSRCHGHQGPGAWCALNAKGAAMAHWAESRSLFAVIVPDDRGPECPRVNSEREVRLPARARSRHLPAASRLAGRQRQRMRPRETHSQACRSVHNMSSRIPVNVIAVSRLSIWLAVPAPCHTAVLWSRTAPRIINRPIGLTRGAVVCRWLAGQSVGL